MTPDEYRSLIEGSIGLKIVERCASGESVGISQKLLAGEILKCVDYIDYMSNSGASDVIGGLNATIINAKDRIDCLEALVDKQEETISTLRDTVHDLQDDCGRYEERIELLKIELSLAQASGNKFKLSQVN